MISSDTSDRGSYDDGREDAESADYGYVEPTVRPADLPVSVKAEVDGDQTLLMQKWAGIKGRVADVVGKPIGELSDEVRVEPVVKVDAKPKTRIERIRDSFARMAESNKRSEAIQRESDDIIRQLNAAARGLKLDLNFTDEPMEPDTDHHDDDDFPMLGGGVEQQPHA
jgi:hypothetical protein